MIAIFSLVQIFAKHSLFALEENFTKQKFTVGAYITILLICIYSWNEPLEFMRQENPCKIRKNLHLMENILAYSMEPSCYM